MKGYARYKVWPLKLVSHGFVMPRFYGVAWVQWSRDRAVVAPVPLNLILAFFRSLWIWMTYPCPLAGNARDAYRQGVDEGIRRGREARRGPSPSP